MFDLKALTQEQLETLWTQLSEERYQRALTAAPDPFVIIKGQEAAKRALIVAAAGKHPIMFWGPSGVGKSMLVAAAAKVGVEAFEMWGCLCGCFGDPRQVCKCSQGDISEYWQSKTVLLDHVDIVCEVPPVPEYVMQQSRSGTSLKDVQEQLSRFKPLQSLELDECASMLLKQAVSELGLPIKRRVKAISVAASIAGLNGRTCIGFEAICEALMYRRRG